MYARQRLALGFVPLITLFSFVNDALATCPIIQFQQTQAMKKFLLKQKIKLSGPLF